MISIRLGAFALAISAVAAPLPWNASRQMIVVTTSGWDARQGSLQRFNRRGDVWKPVGAPLEVVVGRNGLAWGIGLHPPQSDGPVKKEGDGRSPAGVFRISRLFGYAAATEAGKFGMPYLQATATLECVDDEHSAHYNEVIDRAAVASPDWSSSEKMRRPDEAYRWGAVVDHNAPPARASAGSCIFLHVAVTGAAAKGTSGCTAMAQPALLDLLHWLDLAHKPVLVQLPKREYDRLRRIWQLPHLRS